MARLAHAIAIENPMITSDVIEVEEFPALAKMYNVRGVPNTVMSTTSQLASISPQIQFVGALPEAEFVAKVLEAGVKDDADNPASQSTETGTGPVGTVKPKGRK